MHSLKRSDSCFEWTALWAALPPVPPAQPWPFVQVFLSRGLTKIPTKPIVYGGPNGGLRWILGPIPRNFSTGGALEIEGRCTRFRAGTAGVVRLRGSCEPGESGQRQSGHEYCRAGDRGTTLESDDNSRAARHVHGDGHGHAAEPYCSPRPLARRPANLAHADPPCTTRPGGARPVLVPAESEINAGDACPRR